MNSAILAAVALIAYVAAYHTYGRFLARRIFRIDPARICPSVACQDGRDFVPTRREVVFGHHFTSIAGLGPIVGPAVAVVWGWAPALLWVLFGSILMGAVHDFGSLVVSLRSQGRSVGDIAGDLISPRARTLFSLIILAELWVVLAVFALIVAMLLVMYPEAVLPVWLSLPIAVLLGRLVNQWGWSPGKLVWGAVLLLYLAVGVGVYLPIRLPEWGGISPVMLWMLILMVYTYWASILPVQTLLQPRDYINAYQLFVAMGLLALGVLVAQPPVVAPALELSPPGAPPLFPFLFVIIACGAISGFHCLVSSGVTSKQCRSEGDAQWLGFGAMLTESALAVLAIVACTAGIGMGLVKGGATLYGSEAFNTHYADWSAVAGMGSKLEAFVSGAANIIGALGLPAPLAVAIFSVFIVSFAATTLDSAARIQRYVIAELAGAYGIKRLQGRHTATALAVGSALLLAFSAEGGKGALVLWPIFGTVNQLLAGLALLVVSVYLLRQGAPLRYTVVPMVIMVAMTGWAMLLHVEEFWLSGDFTLMGISVVVLVLEIWLIWEAVGVFKKAWLGDCRTALDGRQVQEAQ